MSPVDLFYVLARIAIGAILGFVWGLVTLALISRAFLGSAMAMGCFLNTAS
jgi:NhaP-type Na+/H+ and K+/H+ antiporter